MPWNEFLMTFGSALGIALAAAIVLWLASIAMRDMSIIDRFFPSVIMAMLTVAWMLTERHWLSELLIVLIGLWAVRVTVHTVYRNWGHGEDARYTEVIRNNVAEGWPLYWASLRQVFLLQCIGTFILVIPALLAMITGAEATFGPLAMIGLTLWVIGFLCETIGDIQLMCFQAKPENKGKVLESGLWRYSRHPNYFGELTQWWGLFLIAMEAPWAWCAFISPVIYTLIMVFETGFKPLEEKLLNDKPDYANYVRRTSIAIPWFPKA